MRSHVIRVQTDKERDAEDCVPNGCVLVRSVMIALY